MKYLKIFICLFLIIMSTGCSINKTSEATETPEKSEATEKIETNIDESEELKKQQERESQTLWAVLDSDGNEKEMISDTNKDVQAIINAIENHCATIDNRNYKKLNLDDEYKYYSDDFITTLDKANYKEAVENMYKTNKLVLSQENIIWYKNYLDEDMNKCKVTIEGEFKITEGSKEYLEKNEMSLDDVYQEKRIYYLEKVDNEWKVNNIEKGALTKRSTSA